MEALLRQKIETLEADKLKKKKEVELREKSEIIKKTKKRNPFTNQKN